MEEVLEPSPSDRAPQSPPVGGNEPTPAAQPQSLPPPTPSNSDSLLKLKTGDPELDRLLGL
ncbi:MAG: hypothetical protein D6753_11995 [Planctomycetota bacterium]|nr:MAG: hypothetical protein D6753_11995 [Planctomycetota bacterium]